MRYWAVTIAYKGKERRTADFTHICTTPKEAAEDVLANFKKSNQFALEPIVEKVELIDTAPQVVEVWEGDKL